MLANITKKEDAVFMQELRAKRLVQISCLIIVALTIVAPFYIVRGNWPISLVLILGIAMMGLCLLLHRRRKFSQAILLLLFTITTAMSGLAWIGEGLGDVALLTFPAILVAAGLLTKPRHFFFLLAAMLAFIIVMTLSTEVYGLRSDLSKSHWLPHLRDTGLVLLAGGFVVWLIIKDLHQALINLRYFAQHDDLTGLTNRSTGRSVIDQAIIQAGRRKLSVALLFVDIDNFKAVNDSLGHDAGDKVLKQIAGRLSRSVRKSDILTRHGGDDFVIALTDIADIQDVTAVASTVLRALDAPITHKETEISLSCSIGIALYPNDGSDYKSLLRTSDLAMYQAKESGRNTICFFDAAMDKELQQSLVLISEMRSAVEREEFVLHYQPVIHLSTGRLAGAEALVRWQHPVRGLVLPDSFIPAAEQSGLILRLGEWVLNKACRQTMKWHSAGLGEFFIAVNLSPVQFRRGNIVEVVQGALQRSGLPAQYLELEITESTLIQDSEKFMLSLKELKSLGVRISIDDFGTGYSNLSYLQRFAVDKLKVDQSFVMQMLQSREKRPIVNAIIQLANSLNLSTTAEGIEEDGIRQALMDLGCELGQGNLFSLPLPEDQFGNLFLNDLVKSG